MSLSWRDDWPTMPDGSDFEGEQLLTLVRSGNSPFHGVWDVNILIREIEENFGAQVIDIPVVNKGSNNYGFHIKLSNGSDIVARLSRGDVNMPNFEGFPICSQISEVEFEVAVYKLLRSEPNILVSRLLYYRIPVEHAGTWVGKKLRQLCSERLQKILTFFATRVAGHKFGPPQDIAGRRLFVFERAKGEKDIWWDLNPDEQDCLLAQVACIRASLFKFELPHRFAEAWLRERLFQRSSEQKPKSFPIPVAPTRGFCIAMFESKIKAIIGNQGDKIGFEDDNYTVGPITAAAKRSLLRVLPHILPADSKQPSLYRLVLEHGDFGIHNMLTTFDASGQPLVTSIYDWEAGGILPAILSNPKMLLCYDLVEDKNGAPSVAREAEDATPEERAEHMRSARVYFKALYEQVPNYKRVIQAGKDARHLWYALQDWDDEQPEEYFGNLGAWAERKMKGRCELIRVTDHGFCPCVAFE